MNLEFEARKTTICGDIANAVLSSIPTDWNMAVLKITRLKLEFETDEALCHELMNPEINEGLNCAIPEVSVYEHSRRLELLYEEAGLSWSKGTFTVHWNDELEQWEYEMQLE